VVFRKAKRSTALAGERPATPFVTTRKNFVFSLFHGSCPATMARYLTTGASKFLQKALSRSHTDPAFFTKASLL
jgi:hypothetical protein